MSNLSKNVKVVKNVKLSKVVKIFKQMSKLSEIVKIVTKLVKIVKKCQSCQKLSKLKKIAKFPKLSKLKKNDQIVKNCQQLVSKNQNTKRQITIIFVIIMITPRYLLQRLVSTWSPYHCFSPNRSTVRVPV